MAQDPNFAGSYAVNTSTLPVYVLPPEQYTQQFGDQNLQQTYAPAYAQPAFFPQQFTQTAPVSTTTSQPTVTNHTDAQSLLARIQNDSAKGVLIGQAFGESFSHYRKNCGVYLVLCFLAAIFITVSILVPLICLMYLEPSYSLVWILPQLIQFIILPPLVLGCYNVVLEGFKTGQPQLRNFFTVLSPSLLCRYYALKIVAGMVVVFGLLLLVIPGIYCAICFLFIDVLFLEYPGLSIINYLAVSKAVVSKNWCSWFGFVLLAGLISLLPFGAPVAFIAVTLAFKEHIGFADTYESSAYALTTAL